MKTALLFLIIFYYQNKIEKQISFIQESVTVILIYTTYLKDIFIYQKMLYVLNILSLFFFEQTLKDIIQLLHHIAGLDMNLED